MQNFVQKNENALSGALRKLHQNDFRVVPYDWIDQANSSLTNLLTIPGANLLWLFEGDLQHPGGSLSVNGGPNDNFRYTFVKPLYLDWTFIRADVINQLSSMTVTYADGAVEALVHNVIGFGSYDVFLPPTQAKPVISILFTNMGAVPINLYSTIITLKDPAVSVSVTGGIIASTNDFYTDDILTPIPLGLIGVAIVYGFNTQAILLLNYDTAVIEFSEDGGISWNKVQPKMGIVRYAILRTGVHV